MVRRTRPVDGKTEGGRGVQGVGSGGEQHFESDSITSPGKMFVGFDKSLGWVFHFRRFVSITFTRRARAWGCLLLTLDASFWITVVSFSSWTSFDGDARSVKQSQKKKRTKKKKRKDFSTSLSLRAHFPVFLGKVWLVADQAVPICIDTSASYWTPGKKDRCSVAWKSAS